jgi:hypothetical protein
MGGFSVMKISFLIFFISSSKKLKFIFFFSRKKTAQEKVGSSKKWSILGRKQ